MAQLLAGTWHLKWSKPAQRGTDRSVRHDMHAISFGILPLIARVPRIHTIRQVISVADKWVVDTAEVQFDDGFCATWTAHGDLMVPPAPAEGAPLEYSVVYKTGRLLSRQGIPAEFAGYVDKRLDMGRRVAHRTVLVITDSRRIEREDWGEVRMLVKM